MPTRYRARALDNAEVLAVHHTPGRTAEDMNRELGADILTTRPETTDDRRAILYRTGPDTTGELHPGLWLAAFDDGSITTCDDISFRAMFAPLTTGEQAAA